MSVNDSLLEKLLAALLSVNGYPVDRALGLMPSLRMAGVLSPATVGDIPQDEMVKALNEAGYGRGGYLPIMSYRVYKLMEAVADGKLDDLEGYVADGDKGAFGQVLSSVHGFGPSTIETAWSLAST